MWFWLAQRDHAKRSASLAILGPMQETAKIQEGNKKVQLFFSKTQMKVYKVEL